MATILQIETSTGFCSAAVAVDGQTVALKETAEKNAHAASLTLFIASVMQQAGIDYPALDAVAVGMGPGSYTGLRIGVSTAKGICFAAEKPLIAISTLKMMAYGYYAQHPDFDGLVCPMIDARRMEVYTALYNSKLNEILAVNAMIIDENSLSKALATQKIVFIGDGAAKCMPVISSPNAIFVNENFNSATWMSRLAAGKFQNGALEDVAYFEPFYLKDFMLTPPKNRL